MKVLTKKRQEWLWFVLLWCGGLAGTVLLAFFVRLVVSIRYTD